MLVVDDTVCYKCGSNVVVDHKHGKIRCTECGLIIEDRFVDPTSEYRFFTENTSPQNDPRRVGNMVNQHLDSQIDLIEIDQGKREFIRVLSHFCSAIEPGQDVHSSH